MPEPSDSGAHLFWNGKLYYRQLDDLALNMCVARSISDAEWLEFLEGSLLVAKKVNRMPKAVMATFTQTYPGAKQRRELSAFLKSHGVRPVERLGIVSDNPLIRGAVVAFHWAVPDASALAFGGREVERCLEWLSARGRFDAALASTAWSEGRAALRMR